MSAEARPDTSEALELALGDPHDPAAPSGFARALAHDEAETFPDEAFATLVRLGYLQHLVPRELGGALTSFEDLLRHGKVVARRDLSLAIATGQCLLGALPVWLAGSPEQKAQLAASVGEGHSGALALTEEAHGSDLQASEVVAERDAQGYVLRGEKWCINNATRGRTLTVLARTDAQGGARGFSLFMVDKQRLDASTLAPLPKLRTHGIRAADISGMDFRGTRLGLDTRVGKEGQGLELVFKTMQVSRTMCSAFSLGAADTALRLATEFAQGRVLYGASAHALPAVQAELREAFVCMLLADLLAHVGTRALSLMPEQMSVLSAVVKVLVPALCGEAIERAAVVLGARHYLREGRYAIFQKLRRDAAVVALFDGSSAVNRQILAGQLLRLSAARAEERALRGKEQGERARSLLRLSEPVPAFEWHTLKTSSRGRDDVLGGLEDTVALGEAGAEPRETSALGALLLRAREAFDAQVLSADEHGDHALTELSNAYLWLVAGACVVHHQAVAQGQDDWLRTFGRLALGRALRELSVAAPSISPAGCAALDARLLTLCAEGRMLSLHPTRLAAARSALP